MDTILHIALIIDNNGNIIVKGVNDLVHAEISAINHFEHIMHKFNVKRKHFSILVLRVTGNGLRLSKPCINCMKSILKRKNYIKYIGWSNDNNNFTYIKNNINCINIAHIKRKIC